MTAGDVVVVKFHDGTKTDLLLDAACTPDPTSGQWDDGFWAHDPTSTYMGTDDPCEYFVSANDASVWGMPDNHYCGDVLSVSSPHRNR